MSCSRLSAAATCTAATMQLSTKMASAAIDCADFELPTTQQLPPSPFINGVMPQPSSTGRWCGAQTTRKWMGTFPDEETPACGDADQAAPARRRQWRASRGQPAATWGAREHLFQKALTRSDVGRLNRLVVPKHHAEKHLFPSGNPMMAAGIGVLIDFVDGSGKTWRFKYSFSATSGMYIITRGWRRFVREKGLQAGDTVAFSRSAFGAYKQMHIDCRKTQKKPEDAVMLFGVDIARV